MTDRELMEKAAKAHGGVNFGCERWYDSETDDVWNPLEDDGDALRLAVRLKIDFQHDAFSDEACIAVKEDYWFEEAYGTNPDAATRRAIVRAAASLAGD